MNVVYLGTYTFTDADIISAGANLQTSIVGEELMVDTFTMVLTNHNQSLTGLADITYGTVLKYFKDDQQIGTYYFKSFKRKTKTQYQIDAISSIGLLDKQYHTGGIYTGETLKSVVEGILGPSISDALIPVAYQRVEYVGTSGAEVTELPIKYSGDLGVKLDYALEKYNVVQQNNVTYQQYNPSTGRVETYTNGIKVWYNEQEMFGISFNIADGVSDTHANNQSYYCNYKKWDATNNLGESHIVQYTTIVKGYQYDKQFSLMTAAEYGANNQRHEIKFNYLNDRKIYIDNRPTSIVSTETSFTSEYNFGLGGLYTYVNDGSGVVEKYSNVNYSYTNIYDIELTKGNQTVFHGIPCYYKETGATGLYDIISKTFVPMVGTTRHGADIVDVERFFDYIFAEGIEDIAVYGWLPYDTKRNNLYQVLFANNINLIKTEDGRLLFTYLQNENPIPISRSKIFAEGEVEYSNLASKVELTEHTYKYDPEEEANKRK